LKIFDKSLLLLTRIDFEINIKKSLALK
jgi:hypothetical protein